MTINIYVINQELRLATPFRSLVDGTQEFIKFKFILDNAWSKITTFAQFTQNGTAYNVYLDENNCVYLPPEINTGTFTLMLYGTGNNTIGTSNYLTLKVSDNILIEDAQSTEVTQSLYSQLVNIVDGVNDNINTITTARTSDVGKYLKVKSVNNGKVSAWEFDEGGSSGGGGGSGQDGQDGYSPTITVTNITGGHRVSITDVNGTKRFDVMNGTNGTDGTDGSDGFSPTITVTNITNGHRVSITDATGTNTFDVMDGSGSDSGTTTEVYYVTPEDYGAVGDGSTDDTSAFSQACNSGKPVVLTQGKTYKIDTVTVTSPLIIIGNFATVSTTASSSVKNTFIIRANAISATINDVNFTTTLGINTTGAHGEAIPNRSLRTCIASYGVDKLSVINCTFENFDNGIIGITQSSDTVYASVPESLFVKDTKITNCLMGISRHYKNVVIDGCHFQVDTNAQSGEHCIYLLSDVLSDAYITNTTLITDGSSAGACVNIRPRTGEAGANLVDGVYKIDGCTMIGDGYVHVHGGGKCYVTSCTLKTVNYNTTAKMRQFACPSTDDSVIDVSGCSVNLELQDGLTERVIYRGCDVYTNGTFSTRFALFKAYNCQFDNIGINVADGAEIVGCVFSSTSGVAGNYYVLVGSTITASTIIGCTFNTGTNVNMIAYNSSGKCLLVAVISSLPNGNNITGLTFYHKIDPTQPESGSGTDGFSPIVTVTEITGGHRVTITDATGDKTFDVMDGSGSSSDADINPWKDKKICIFGDSIGQGYNNNNHSYADILSESGMFASVHKNCVAGTTTATWTARLQESSTEIADADIIYAEYEANDIVGLKAGTLTTDALVSTVRNCTSAIRNVNPTCAIVWLPLTIQHLSKIAGTDLSYYQSWVNAMYPVFAELGINMIPIFDTLNANHASSDGRHPNEAGQSAIADLIMQNPLGYSSYSTENDDSGSDGDSSVDVYYVTPEDYGAMGDGTTNDTNAMSQAFNSGKPVVLTQGKTYFVQQLTVTHPLLLIGNNATIATRSITIEEYNNGGQRMFIFDDSATEVYIKDVNFYTTADQTIYGAHGDRDAAIPNRSIRCAIAAYGVDKLSVVNCTFTNFDTPINGQRHGSDTTYEHIANNFYLKDCRIHNSLMGVIGYFHHIVVDGCEIIEDANARSGEHCLYFLIDVLDTAVIANSSFYTHDGDCGSCIQFYIPNTTSTLPTGIKREYRIDGCQFFGDAFISNSGGGKCYVSACTMKTINYRSANRRRQFECAITDGGVIEVTDSVVNLELQDRIDQALVFRNCNVYSTRLLSDRFALYKAYGCQFDNISFRVANDAEIINCVFSSSVSVLGKYYFTVPSTTTASSIVDCIFNTGSNVSVIAYGCVGTCNLISTISELPIGTDNSGLIVIHKVDSTGSSDSGGSDGNSGSRVLYNGTANIVADTINYVALNDISTVLEVGDTYRVTWNGIASTLTAKSVEINGTEVVVIGNPGTDGATDDGSGLTYCGYKYSATVLAFSTTDSAGRITLKVEKIVGDDTSIFGNAIFIGDSICLGYNNNNISFVDILASRGIFSSVSKKAVIGCGTSNFTTYAATIPEGTWADADIVYLCLQSDDVNNRREIGAIGDTTNDTISGSISVIFNYIRNLNPTCTIVMLTFTRTNWRRYVSSIPQAWLKKWNLIAMQKAHSLGIREIPFYDIIDDGLVARDGLHPNMEGHKRIANLIQQNPYGISDPVLIWSEIEPTVLFDGTATIRADSDSNNPNYIVLSNVTDTMSVGDVYRVTWGNATTTLTAKEVTISGNEVIMVGNPGIEPGQTDDGSGLTYCGYRYSATAMAFATTDAVGTINLKIEKINA